LRLELSAASLLFFVKSFFEKSGNQFVKKIVKVYVETVVVRIERRKFKTRRVLENE